MHEILFLLFGKFLVYNAQLLYTYQEEDGFHIGLFAKPFHELLFELPPAGL
jgi:hypothetical protein